MKKEKETFATFSRPTLESSKDEFIQECYDYGYESADEWIENCTDYAELTRIANGYGLSELPEFITDTIRDSSFVEEFGGVPDEGAILKGLNDALIDRQADLLALMEIA